MASPSERDEASLPAASSQRPQPDRRPSLLPAFEPLSSPLPKASKRKFDETCAQPAVESRYYPTPVPTSSTGMIPSSPPVRPGLHRTTSTVSERTPLCTVPSIAVPHTGERLFMGRSSTSSHHQLSANRLISRVHVSVAYKEADDAHPSGRVVIECLGWNGAKVHCRGKAYELGKGDIFSSDKPAAEIMLDVQDARVIIEWPRLVSESVHSDLSWHEDLSPSRAIAESRAQFLSSPPSIHPRSPVSPTPANPPNLALSSTFLQDDEFPEAGHATVHVYEDRESGDDNPKPDAPEESSGANHSSSHGLSAIKAAEASQISATQSDEYSDRDEENDPIIHSFGPFGDNILPRLASFTTTATSPQIRRRRRPLKPSGSPSKQRRTAELVSHTDSPIKNHVINQLAFSRLHSIPLSTIFGNLPSELKAQVGEAHSGLSSSDKGFLPSSLPMKTSDEDMDSLQLSHRNLKNLLDAIPCVGEINREGKDAAGKPLENEFYYVPEMDTNVLRKEAVVGGIGGTGLRAVRRSHKQYYWKRPRH